MRRTKAGTRPRSLNPDPDRLLDVAAAHGDGLARLETDVNRILVDAETAMHALTAALAAICERLGPAEARYWQLGTTTARLHLRAACDARGALPARPDAVGSGPGDGLVGEALAQAGPFWITDIRTHARAGPEDVARLGASSALLVPVGSHSCEDGLFEFSGADLGEPDEALVQVLDVLARRIARTYARLGDAERLQDSADASHSTFELAAIGIAHIDCDGRLIHVNRQLCELLGYSSDELVGRTVKDISHPDDVNVTDEQREKLRTREIDSFTAEKRYIRSDGAPVWVRITVAERRDAKGETLYHVSVIEDISERKGAEEELRASEEFYHETFELAAIGISHVSAGGELLHTNGQLCEMLGYSRDELVGKTVWEISHPDDLHATDEHRTKLQAGEIDAFKMEKRYLRKDGSPVWVKITAAIKRGPDGEPLHYVSIVEDISERKAAEERIEYLATHDELTELPNRAMFRALLSSEVELAKRYDRTFSVLFVDLDRFKLINDSLGHEAGDILLKEMARRFQCCLRKSDVVARLGGDEFVVLVREVEDPTRVASVARKLLSESLRAVTIGVHECRVTASIGICTFPSDASDAQSVMKRADMAMYLAKEEGKNNFQFFSEGVHSTSFERLTLENALRQALERDEFSVQYQPKVDIRTGDIKGVEALLRWNSAELGAVPPARFVPLAEDMGLIIPIGKWVLRTACAQNVAWQRAGLPAMTMAVNLSPRQFRDPDLLDDIVRALSETGMVADLLELEITEGMLMHDLDKAVDKLNGLKEAGVRISIDDFGTGYSSLAHLKRFPIDTLKVDRSFIRDLPADSEDKAITEAIISMGRTLGVSVIAEGVETSEQQSFLKSHDCDQLQGFFFSKPADADELETRLREHFGRSTE